MTQITKRTRFISPFFALLLAAREVLAQEAVPGPGKFFFQWPTQVSQCQLVNLTWGAGAVAPFQAWVVPIGQQPFVYQIPASAYRNGQGAYQIQVQLNQGTNYVMLMSDARGTGSGGTSALQIVGSSPNTACLNTASQNQTAKAFSYSVAGRAQQCSPGFEIQWDGSPDNSPYNFTVIPLTQKYYPFDVVIDESSGYSSDWVLNMTSGTRFTILMNDKNRYGSGGAAGIYEVANNNSSGSACVTQSPQGTGAWPVGVATNTLPVATNPPQSPRNTSGGITGGAIAGIVIGVLAALVLAGLMVWFLLRRKRRAGADGGRRGDSRKANELDLADSRSETGDDALGEGAGRGYSDSQVGAQPLVSPYPASSAGGPGGGGGRYSAVPGDDGRPSYSAGEGAEMSERGTMTSAGFAGLGVDVGAAGSPWERDGRSRGSSGGDVGTRMAGPLPSKHPLGPLGPSSAGRSNQSSVPPTPISTHHSIPTPTTGTSNGKREREHQSVYSLPPGAGPAGSGGGGGGGMRVVNHDRPEDIPAVERGTGPGTGGSAEGGGGRLRRERDSRQMQFRRHEDAGRVDIVDLPPLYTDVPREEGREEEGDVGERSPLSGGAGSGRR